MAILTLPATPRFRAGSTLRPVTNTLSHTSSLDRTTQTLEFPGVHWMGDYALPALAEADGETWAAFLAELDGPAGRFYAGDPFRITPRGVATTIGAHENDIPNNTMVGAVVGTIGSGGALPTGWTINNNSAGWTIEIIGTGVEANIEHVDIRWSAPTGTGSGALNLTLNNSIPAVNTDPRALSAYITLIAGSTNDISITLGHNFTDGAFSFLGNNQVSIEGAVVAGALQNNRHSFLDTVNEVGTVFSRPIFNVFASVATTPDITLRIGLPQDEPETAVTAPIRTSGTARSRPAGPFVQGGSQSGKAIKTGGWTPEVTGILLAGDYESFDLPSGGRSMHKLTADVTSDVSGEITAAIRPPLRESPADVEPVLIAPATCVMRLIDDDQARWSVDETGIFTIAFSAIESFNTGA